MNEPEFHTMLTTLSVAVQSFRELSLRCGHALAGNRSDGIEVCWTNKYQSTKSSK